MSAAIDHLRPDRLKLWSTFAIFVAIASLLTINYSESTTPVNVVRWLVVVPVWGLAVYCGLLIAAGAPQLIVGASGVTYVGSLRVTKYRWESIVSFEVRAWNSRMAFIPIKYITMSLRKSPTDGLLSALRQPPADMAIFDLFEQTPKELCELLEMRRKGSGKSPNNAFERSLYG